MGTNTMEIGCEPQQGWPGRAQGSCSYCPLTPQHVFDIEGTLRVRCSVQYKPGQTKMASANTFLNIPLWQEIEMLWP